jgi:hypothetical protein
MKTTNRPDELKRFGDPKEPGDEDEVAAPTTTGDDEDDDD